MPDERSKIKLAILASGSGTNLENIAQAIEDGEIPAKVSIVISDNPKAFALKRASRRGIPARVILASDYPDRKAYDQKIIEVLQTADVGLVVLAGYMKLVGPRMVEAFEGRIMNIHPALLPSFPGTHSVRDALEYGVKVSGVTVHFVDTGLDTGPIILQESVPVLEGDDEETLHDRIHQVEYRLFPEAIRLYAEKRLVIEGRRVRLLPESGSFA